MQRRRVVGVIAAAGTGVLGTGAFTQIQAKRGVNGNVTTDGQAQLQLRANKNSLQNGEYASYDGGEILLDLAALNPDSRTTLGGVFEIINVTGEPVYVYLEDNTSVSGRLTFFRGDPPGSPLDTVEGPSNAVELGTGGTGKMVVGVDLDLHGTTDSFSFGTDDNFVVVASTDDPSP